MFFWKKKPAPLEKHPLDHALELISLAKRIFNRNYRDKSHIPTKAEIEKHHLIQGRLRRTYKKARRVTAELQCRYDRKYRPR